MLPSSYFRTARGNVCLSGTRCVNALMITSGLLSTNKIKSHRSSKVLKHAISSKMNWHVNQDVASPLSWSQTATVGCCEPSCEAWRATLPVTRHSLLLTTVGGCCHKGHRRNSFLPADRDDLPFRRDRFSYLSSCMAPSLCLNLGKNTLSFRKLHFQITVRSYLFGVCWFVWRL